uniref:Uncharacterized protein n=1 Tax=Panagrolaimus superbus TaxID=310955 RepID=A0A914YWW0_9BILA
MLMVKSQVLRILFIFCLLKFVFGLPFPSSSSKKRDVSSTIQKTIDELYSKLMDSEFENLRVKAAKLLPIDIDRENINFYINEEEEDDDGFNRKTSVCENSTSSFTPPFPAFVTPFMTLLASQYTEWRHRNPKKLSCLVSQLKSIDSHPCPHENSSCVVISLPNNHVFFGCMNDKTGELVAPKNWDVLKSTNDSDKFLIDFRGLFFYQRLLPTLSVLFA